MVRGGGNGSSRGRGRGANAATASATKTISSSILQRLYAQPMSLRDALTFLATGVDSISSLLVRPGDTYAYSDTFLGRTLVAFESVPPARQQAWRLSQRFSQEQVCVLNEHIKRRKSQKDGVCNWSVLVVHVVCVERACNILSACAEVLHSVLPVTNTKHALMNFPAHRWSCMRLTPWWRAAATTCCATDTKRFVRLAGLFGCWLVGEFACLQ